MILFVCLTPDQLTFNSCNDIDEIEGLLSDIEVHLQECYILDVFLWIPPHSPVVKVLLYLESCEMLLIFFCVEKTIAPRQKVYIGLLLLMLLNSTFYIPNVLVLLYSKLFMLGATTRERYSQMLKKQKN